MRREILFRGKRKPLPEEITWDNDKMEEFFPFYENEYLVPVVLSCLYFVFYFSLVDCLPSSCDGYYFDYLFVGHGV